jgi:serine/threonine protein kinase
LIEEDGDYLFHDKGRLSFEYKKVLGNGWSDVVEKVQHTGTKKYLLRRSSSFPMADRKFRQKIATVMRLISFAVSKVIAISYSSLRLTQRHEKAVCSCSRLRMKETCEYLYSYADAADQPLPRRATFEKMTKVLEQASGCLSSGLAYMHDKGICHKAIKPANILIHQGIVIHTDFSASRDTTKEWSMYDRKATRVPDTQIRTTGGPRA